MAFSDWNEEYVKYRYTGVYAVLTKKNEQELKNLHQVREIDSIRKFIKSNVFYPYYLEENNVQQFISLIRIKKLRYNSCLNWKDEDGSHKIGVVFRDPSSSFQLRLELNCNFLILIREINY